MALKSGDVLGGRYRIVKPVGQGGFGAVYRAWDLSLKVPVALKENLDTSAEAQHQFEQEAQLLAPLRHPNLPRVSDHFFLPGQGQYLVMDFVEGKSLAALLAERGGPLGEAEALNWIGQVCDALEYLHTRTPPVIHRDVKPENIIVTAEGRAMLVDFGISKAYDPSLTTTRGARAVTPGYSPPEQYGMGKTDARSDVYALGATLYTLLTGRQPPESVLLVSGNEALTPIRRVNPGVDARTEAAVAAAMALSTGRRLSSATALKAALAGRAMAPLLAVGQTTAVAAQTGGRRGAPAWLWALAGLAAAAILAVGAYLVWAGGQTEAETPTVVAAAGAGGAETATLPATTEKVTTQVAAATAPSAPAATPATPAATAIATKTPEPATATSPPSTATPANRRALALPGGARVAVAFVPAGSFAMGADDDDSDGDEAPIHNVRLNAFWIDELEVTNALFDAFVADTGYVTTDELDGAGHTVTTGTFELVRSANWRHPQGPGSDLTGRSQQPVTLVSWDDARAYCAWAGGRLPTEAEWEYAARGPDALTFPWGNSFSAQRANYCDRNCPPFSWANDSADDGYRFMADVGTFAGGASWVGALDMAGNVWEWTADWYGEHYYATSPVDNPQGPARVGDAGKTIRGGAWSSEIQGVRSAVRVPISPANGHYDVGIRCVYDSVGSGS